MLESVEKISGAKRKQNLTEHADDARVSKQLATMVDDVEVPIAVTEQVRSVPDRSSSATRRLRVARGQRLDDEWDEVVPGRMVEETIEVEAQEEPGRPRRRPDLHRDRRRAVGRQRQPAGRRRRRASDLGGLAAGSASAP